MSASKIALLPRQQSGKEKRAKLTLLPAIIDHTNMSSMVLDEYKTTDNAIVEHGNAVGLGTDISVAPLRMTGRKRKRRSIVWSYFEILPAGKDGRQRCRCRNCGTSYLYDSKFGTGNMKRHLINCLKRDARDAGQLQLIQYNSTVPVTTSKLFDYEKFRELLTEAIILHGLPFQFLEWGGIKTLLLHLRADLQVWTRNATESDCLVMYKREKARLQSTLDETPGKVSITFDLWSSMTTDGYICLTAHFIDKDWNLQKRVLKFCFMAPPYDGTYLVEKIYTFLIEWGIDKKVSTITLNDAFGNAYTLELLKSQLSTSKGLLCNGEFFHIHCCGHVIKSVVQEGLKPIHVAIQKIRESIKYVKGSQARKNIFLECVNHCSLDDKRGLRQDVPTWWNSTFTMLDSALYYRRAFMDLALCDSNYKDCPSRSEWDNIEKINKLLAAFNDITCMPSGTTYPTTNLYFPVVFSAYLMLKEEMGSADEYLRTVATHMFLKFDRYWCNFNVILAIAVILDPRYKFSFVEWCYKKLYGDAGVTESMKVKDKLVYLFSEYTGASKFLQCPKATILSDQTNMNAPENCFSKEATDVFKEFDSFEREESVLQRSQLELYIDEPRLDRKAKLDVLAYWRSNQQKYSEVAAMAHDVLSIPISTVSVENAFDESGRVLDRYHSALKPEMLEALICTKDWLYGEKETMKVTLEELTRNVLVQNISENMELTEYSNAGYGEIFVK